MNYLGMNVCEIANLVNMVLAKLYAINVDVMVLTCGIPHLQLSLAKVVLTCVCTCARVCV